MKVSLETQMGEEQKDDYINLDLVGVLSTDWVENRGGGGGGEREI